MFLKTNYIPSEHFLYRTKRAPHTRNQVGNEEDRGQGRVLGRLIPSHLGNLEVTRKKERETRIPLFVFFFLGGYVWVIPGE